MYLPHMYYKGQQVYGPNIKSFEEIERDISLLLVNIDGTSNYPQTLPPNVIPVGGLHIKPGKNLTGDLGKIFDSEKNGVILFSMGTNLKPESFAKDKIDVFLKAFEKLPYTVIWKYADESLKVPKNVVLRKWLPQSDVLGT